MANEEKDFKNHFTRDHIRSMMQEGMKTVIVRDAAGRPEVSYEAPLNAGINDGCLKTVVKYSDGAAGTSRKVIAMEESVVAWPGYEIVAAGSGDDITLVP